MAFTTDTVKRPAAADNIKRRVFLSQNAKPGGFNLDPNKYTGVRRVNPKPVPKGGFGPIQTADLRDIETRKRNAIVVAQKKAAERALAAKAATPAGDTKPKGKPGRPRKTESAGK